MRLSLHEKEDLLKLAKEAAIQAGNYLLKLQKKPSTILSEKGKDIKIAEDETSESLIFQLLRRGSNLSVLSEETGWFGTRDANSYYWIVDPIDGSMNYLRRIPFSCISIGLWKKDDPILGVVYDFNRKEIFSGIVGCGAWLNHVKIRVSQTKKVVSAILCTGFPSKMEFSRSNIKNFVEQVLQFKKIRMMGSAALSLAYVAAGRADVYHERNIMQWDVAGGLSLVLAAGGRVQISATAQAGSFHIWASNGILKWTA